MKIKLDENLSRYLKDPLSELGHEGGLRPKREIEASELRLSIVDNLHGRDRKFFT